MAQTGTERLAFVAESLAHLNRREREILQLADAARGESKLFEDALKALRVCREAIEFERQRHDRIPSRLIHALNAANVVLGRTEACE